MKNPLAVASGTFGSGMQYCDFMDLSRLGALTTKGVSIDPWEGGPMPRLAEVPSGMLNAIGLQNPGVDAFIEKDLAWLKDKNATVIVNVCGHSIDEYVRCLEKFQTSEVPCAFEINLSCPNVDAGGMALGTDPCMVEKVTSTLRTITKKPLIVKLTPNVTDITEIARAVQAGGADAISMINTVSGMAICARTRTPALARVTGGLSGPAIKPIALACVWKTHRAVDIPILGMGGVTCGEDVIEFMLAGASAVAIGTANFTDPHTAIKAIDEVEHYCAEQGVHDISDLIGELKC